MTYARILKSIFAAMAMVVLLAATAQAKVLDTSTPDVIRMVVGKSTIISTEKAVSRVTLASEAIVTMVVISPTQIYLTAKELGSTTMTLWTGKDVSAVYDVVVTPDVTRLKRMIHEILPNESNVQVLSSGDSITLSGYVSNTSSLASVLSLAEAEAPEKVVNLLSVDGIHQVMLEVRVAEMSRSVTKRFGFNFAAIGNNFTIYSIINNLTRYNAQDDLFEVTDNINMTGTYRSG